jgi:hypothetical protein
VSSHKEKTMAGCERRCLEFLANGGAFVAVDIQASLNTGQSRGGMPFIYEALINMERYGLVCRASDYENPITYYQWKITGCGLLSLAAVSQW